MDGVIKPQALGRAEVIDLLRAHDITPTSQRVEIGGVLFACAQHVTADHLLEQVNRGKSSVSKATIYNTLAVFADKGLIREVVVDPTKRFYDTNLEPHHHIYHTDRGTLEDVSAENVRVNCLPELPDDAVVEGVDVIVRVRRKA